MTLGPCGLSEFSSSEQEGCLSESHVATYYSVSLGVLYSHNPKH